MLPPPSSRRPGEGVGQSAVMKVEPVSASLRPDWTPEGLLQLIVTVLLPSVVESVQETVGRTVKLSLRRRVQLEVKGDKVESRVLVRHACAPRASRLRRGGGALHRHPDPHPVMLHRRGDASAVAAGNE